MIGQSGDDAGDDTDGDAGADSGEIAGYSYARLPHGLIAVRTPAGETRMLPAAEDAAAAVRAFIAEDSGRGGGADGTTEEDADS